MRHQHALLDLHQSEAWSRVFYANYHITHLLSSATLQRLKGPQGYIALQQQQH